MKQKIKKISIIILLCISFFFTLPRETALAADFETQIDFTYSVNSQGIMHIKEIRTIQNNSSRYYIKSDTSENFTITSFKVRSETSTDELERIKDTVKLSDANGQKLEALVKIEDSVIKIQATYGADLNKGNSRVFVLEYDNFELAEKNGNVWNIYVPGMSEEFDDLIVSDVGAVTSSSFSVSLEVDKKLGDPSFVLPEPVKSDELEGKMKYVFDPDSMVNQSAWAQIGDKQFYSFKLAQPVETEDSITNEIFNIYYDLLLPRSQSNQEVFFKSIDPEPEYVREDGEGNVVARFRFSNEEQKDIVVEGYIVANKTGQINEENISSISQIDLEGIYADSEDGKVHYKDLLRPSNYWEVDADEIQEKAADLKGEQTSIYDILISDYNFVIESVDYDNLKTGINNSRQGALKTLQGGSSVCMEYSDLLITLLRAQGIPARAAFGYGFDPRAESGTDEGHQWVEVYMPPAGWVSVDPTWGDTGRKSYIGGDVDHALWRVASEDVDTPSPVTKYSMSSDSELELPKFEIGAVSSLDTDSTMTLSEVLDKYPYSSKHQISERIEQLNSFGKVVFLGLPGLVVLILLVLVMIGIGNVLKRMFNR
jgi:transglutaminase-like putative cysteine protease